MFFPLLCNKQKFKGWVIAKIHLVLLQLITISIEWKN
jgi:hypothetical protein